MMSFNPISRDRAAKELAQYYRDNELDAVASRQAEYYHGEGMIVVRPGLDPRWAAKLGFQSGETPSEAALVRFFQGVGADGSATLPTRAELSAYDFTFSAAPEVSVHFAYEKDPAQRARIEGWHRRAKARAMTFLSDQIAYTRRGAGSTEVVRGEMVWITAHHLTSRPVIDVGGAADTTLNDRLQATAASVQLHSHAIALNGVMGPDGRIGAIDTKRMHSLIHEAGAVYQAAMAEEMAADGVEVCLDRTGIAAAIAGTPVELVDNKSKRHTQIIAEARRYAESHGMVWDDLPSSRRFGILRETARISRAGKLDGPLDLAAERQKIEAAGHDLSSPFGRVAVPDRTPAARAERAALAWQHAAKTLGKVFENEAVLDESVLRTHAARALIPHGGGDVSDIDAVYAQIRERGVELHGHVTALIVGDDNGRIRATTDAQLHIEKGVVAHAAQAAQDHTGALTREMVDREVALLDAKARAGGRDGFALNPQQQEAAYALGTKGKVALAIGVAGAGKTTLISPLVAAFDKEGRVVLGIATAWRQANELTGAGIEDGKKPSKGKKARKDQKKIALSDEASEAVEDLRDSGIADQRIFATAALLHAYEKGKITVDSNTVVVVDEVSQLGSRNALRLLQMQKATGCRILGIGDDKQCQAIEAGPTIDLLRRALPGQVPEILETVRQRLERDRTIAGLFREGRAAEAIAMKREDGLARLVEGGRTETFRAAAALWVEMADRCAATPSTTFGMSAPTNADVRGASDAIRVERRRRGEIVGPDRVVECTDKRATETYELRLATGDRVRLFDKVHGYEVDEAGNRLKRNPIRAGVNGTIVEIRSVDDRGIIIRGTTGRLIAVPWEKLQHKQTKQVMLNAGEVYTIDAGQGATRTYWANLLPSGSAGVDANKAYPAESRNTAQTTTLVNADAERVAIQRQRGVGSAAPVTDDDVWANVARNLSQRHEKTSALAFVEAISAVRDRSRELAATTRRASLADRVELDVRFRPVPPAAPAEPIRAPALLDTIALHRVVAPKIRDVMETLRTRTDALRRAHVDIIKKTVELGRSLTRRPTPEVASTPVPTVAPAPTPKPIAPTPAPAPALRPFDGQRITVGAYLERLTQHQAAAAASGSRDVGAYDRAVARVRTMLDAGVVRPDARIAAASPLDKPAYRAAVQQLADRAAMAASRSGPTHDTEQAHTQPAPTASRTGPSR